MLAAIKRRSQLFEIFLLVKLNKLRALGTIWFIKQVSYRVLQELGWLALLPFAFFMHIMGFRRLPVLVQHIGHLAIEPDTFLKAQHLGLIPAARYFILASSKKVPNQHLLSYWREHFKLITNPTLCFFLETLTRHYLACYRGNLHRVGHFGTQKLYCINQLWGKREPILILSKEDEAWGDQALSELGIPKNQWYVCLHVREGGFLPHNESIQSYRNASIENTIPAIQEIVRRGGLVVRMGDVSMAPLKSIPGVIDYVRHPLKSERMDVILCARAKFFLGCTSGLVFLSIIFGVPTAQVNMIPVEALGIRAGDLSIPKLVWSNSLGRHLSYEELMGSKIGGFYYTHEYENAGIRVEENDEEDIRLLVIEMLDRLEGTFVASEADKSRHERYLSLFKPGHYSYRAASRVGLGFLNRHEALINRGFNHG